MGEIQISRERGENNITDGKIEAEVLVIAPGGARARGRWEVEDTRRR